MLVGGRGVPSPNHSEAMPLLIEAVNQHIPEAEHQLAILYEYGKGVPQDFKAAADLYSRAAEQLHVESIYHLGLLYAYGRGVQQSFERAISLFEKASRFDHAPSIYYMGIMKTYGYGTELDYLQAIHWFERAASMDDIRVSEKARKSAEELTRLRLQALESTEDTLQKLKRKSERMAEF